MAVGTAVKIVMGVNSNGVASGLRKINADLRKFERTAMQTMRAARTPLEQYQHEVHKLDTWMAKGKITANEHAYAMRNLGVTYAGVIPPATMAGRAIKAVGLTAAKASGMVKGLAGSLGMLGPMAAVFAAFRIGGNVEDFNQAMNSSLAIMTNVSDKMRKVMEKTAHDVASATKFSSAEAAESYYFLASAGMDAAQAVAALPTVAKFAQAGMFDMATATDKLTDAQMALGLSFKDPLKNMKSMKRVGNVLVAASNAANQSVEQFSTSLTTKAATAMRNYNVSLEEGVALLAMFANQGVKGEAAGTGLSIVLRDLTTKAIRNKEAWEDLGMGQAVYANGAFQGPIAAITAIENKLKGMGDELQKTTIMQLGFNDKSVTNIQSLVGFTAKLDELRTKFSEVGEEIDRVSNNQLTPLGKAWEKLTAEWNRFTTESGTGALEGLSEVIDMLTEGLKRLPKYIMTSQLGFVEMAIAAQKASNAVPKWLRYALKPPGISAIEWATGADTTGVDMLPELEQQSITLQRKLRDIEKNDRTSKEQLNELQKMNTRLEQIEDKLEPQQEAEIPVN